MLECVHPHPWSITEGLLTRYLINCFWEFCRMDKDELIRFWGQKVKGQGHSWNTCGEMSTLGSMFSPISAMHGCILMKLITITRYRVHMISKVMNSKIKVTEIFSENALFCMAKVYQSRLHHHRLSIFTEHLTLLECAIAVDVCLVRPSVCLSVRQTRAPWQKEIIICKHVDTVQ